jgi:hypothetical protein
MHRWTTIANRFSLLVNSFGGTFRGADDTWHARAAYVQEIDPESFYSLGISYESSPVKDKHRTFDFPVDEMWKLAKSMWRGV